MAYDHPSNGVGDSLPTLALVDLHSTKTRSRLQQITNLKAGGVGEHIDLPQVVACGDQSVGKSSVLEGITGIPFPRQDGVCTRFATEIVVEQTEGPLVYQASIRPAQTQSDDMKTKLLQFTRCLDNIGTLPEIISEAGELMGVRGFGDNLTGPAFVNDVFRITMSGPTGLDLTMVDLPGLIASASDDQVEADVATVHKIVESYVQNERTIVLAVVQAGNDIANQGIIKLARTHDKDSIRTVGVITKADLINKLAEPRIAKLAMNQDTTRLGLGFFLVQNPSPEDLKDGVTEATRDKKEKDFFSGPRWKGLGLDMNRVGIKALRGFLRKRLDEHIEREIPKVHLEVKKLLSETRRQLNDLGPAHSDSRDIRVFLSRLAARFQALVISALHGTYHETDAEFFNEEGKDIPNTRLRAAIHELNTAFSDNMRNMGRKRSIVEKIVFEEGDQSAHHGGFSPPRKKPKKQHARHADTVGSKLDDWITDGEEEDENPQLEVSEKEMHTWALEV